MDVTSGVGFGKKSSKIIATDRGLDFLYFRGSNRLTVQASLLKQAADAPSMLEAGAVAIYVQDTALDVVEVDGFGSCDFGEVRARLQGQLYGGDGIAAIARDVRGKFREPAVFVPAGAGVHEQRSIAAQHPAKPLDDCRPMVPDFRIADGQLAAVGIRGLHRGVTMLVKDRDLIPSLHERVCGGDAGDAGADDGDV